MIYCNLLVLEGVMENSVGEVTVNSRPSFGQFTLLVVLCWGHYHQLGVIHLNDLTL
jgi:hypothetical protein